MGICATGMSQQDTLWMVPSGVALGGDTVAALRFSSSPQFQAQNETLENWLGSCVLVNLDSIAHQIQTTVPGTSPVTVEPGEAQTLSLSIASPSTHRMWSTSQRGNLLGLETMIRTGWSDLPHYEWNLNEWDPLATWTVASGEAVDESLPYVPRQFTINDANFPNTLQDTTAHVESQVGEPVYISVVNQGRMDQVLHFHGFHVEMMQSSAHPNRVGWSKDTVPVKAGECVVVRLDPDQPGEYPVHAHNLVAVTNAGFYPGGMITYLNIAP